MQAPFRFRVRIRSCRSDAEVHSSPPSPPCLRAAACGPGSGWVDSGPVCEATQDHAGVGVERRNGHHPAGLGSSLGVVPRLQCVPSRAGQEHRCGICHTACQPPRCRQVQSEENSKVDRKARLHRYAGRRRPSAAGHVVRAFEGEITEFFRFSPRGLRRWHGDVAYSCAPWVLGACIRVSWPKASLVWRSVRSRLASPYVWWTAVASAATSLQQTQPCGRHAI